jgi:hypothetical protein
MIYKCRRLSNLALKWKGCFLDSWNKFIIELNIKLHHIRLVIWDKLLNRRRSHWLINILLHSLHIWILAYPGCDEKCGINLSQHSFWVFT